MHKPSSAPASPWSTLADALARARQQLLQTSDRAGLIAQFGPIWQARNRRNVVRDRQQRLAHKALLALVEWEKAARLEASRAERQP